MFFCDSFLVFVVVVCGIVNKITGDTSLSESPLLTDHQPLLTDHQPLSADHQPLSTDHQPLSTEYQPLRVVAKYMDDVLEDMGRVRVRESVNGAIAAITQVLSVIPIRGSLILPRSLSAACSAVIANGTNKHKCSQVNNVYLENGERCTDEFRIPDEHLAALYTFGADGSPGRTAIPGGVGVDNADFILYVTALPGHNCVKSNTLAYSKTCSHDMDDRPLSAFTNLCPKIVTEDYHQERVVQIVLHELLHVLGMSRDLFAKFRECIGTSCGVRHVVVEDLDGLASVVTPNVVERARRHFGCSASQRQYFGVPLQIENDQYTSHWDERYMQTSIMVPTLGLSHLTVLEEITLALMDDTGWYHVNYSRAQPFTWGRGAGCDFLGKKFCESDEQFYCQTNRSLCHQSLLDKAVCSPVANCRVRKSVVGDECFLSDNEQKSTDLEEVYNWRSRCFMSNLTITDNVTLPSARCYEHRCNQTNLLEIRFHDIPWTLCPEQATLKFDGYFGVVLCPPNGVLCTVADPPPTTLAPTTTTRDPDMTTEVAYLPEQDVPLEISLLFPRLPYHVIERPSGKFLFARAVVDAIVRVTGVAETRVTNIRLTQGSDQDSDHFTFTLIHDAENGLVSTYRVYRLLELSVQTSTLYVDFNDYTYKPSNISYQIIDETSSNSPLNIPVLVGVSVGVTLLVGLVVTLLTVYRRSHSFRRLLQRSQTQTSSPSTSSGLELLNDSRNRSTCA